MKALVRTSPGPHRLEVLELPQPVPAPDEVVLRVAECGICGTDVSVYEGNAAGAVAGGTEIFPMVIGHEFTGMVAARGSAVSAPREDDWVVVNPHLFCGHCAYCRRGEEEICDHRPLISWDRPGGAAEFVAVRATNAYRLEADVARRVGALAEPLAVSVHAIRRVTPLAGARVAVVGAGPIGILLGFAAAEAGLDVTLLGLGVDNARLAAGAQLGLMTATVDGEVGELGGSFDVAFEAAGAGDALSASLALVRKGGQVGALGLPHAPVPIDIAQAVLAEKSILGVRGYGPPDWQRTAELLSAHADVLAALITHDFPLEQIEEAMQTVESRRAVKAVLRPGGDWHTRPDSGSK